jgi:hypothetical protein
MPHSVACAIVHDDLPLVFIADDIDALNWVLALRLVARTRAASLEATIAAELREALREDRWGDAVGLWMEVHPGTVDVYPSYDFYTLPDEALAASELQFTPLFED